MRSSGNVGGALWGLARDEPGTFWRCSGGVWRCCRDVPGTFQRHVVGTVGGRCGYVWDILRFCGCFVFLAAPRCSWVLLRAS